MVASETLYGKSFTFEAFAHHVVIDQVARSHLVDDDMMNHLVS